jgi:hypothetical protein
MVEERNHWKISEFAKILGKHNNTVIGWFRALEEERRLHYINRVNNEKIYDTLDLDIAKFIVEHRDQSWSLDAIYDSLPSHFSLRPFPVDFEPDSKSVQVVDIEKMRATIMNELKRTFEEMASSQMQQQMEGFQKMLPNPEQQRLDRFNDMMAERKVTRILEEEALSMWSTKPVSERFRKVGWFRTEEDRDKRDKFVTDYIDKHFEERMRKEYDL